MALQTIPSNTPYIPHLGTFLNDFTFLDETKNWKIGGGAFLSNTNTYYYSVVDQMAIMINFDKVRAIGGCLREFQNIQEITKNYVIVSSEKIQDYLLGAELWDEQDIGRVSKLLEEVERQSLANTSGSSKNNNSNDYTPYALKHGFTSYKPGRSNIPTDIEALSDR